MKNLSNFLNESKNPQQYKEEYLNAHKEQKPPDSCELKKGQKIYNPKFGERTGNRKAWNNYPWIKYWQAFSGSKENHLKCTCCEKDIFVDINKNDCSSFVTSNSDPYHPITKDDLQAIGGHFYINMKNKTKGYMIAPLCKECNKKSSDEAMYIVNDTVFVFEEDAHIDA